MSKKKLKPFRELDDDFMRELKEGKLRSILEFERKHRKSFMVEIRKIFLNLYFLGHGIDVRKKFGRYYLEASERFNPKPVLNPNLKKLVKKYGKTRWQVSFDDIEKEGPTFFSEIMTLIISKIVFL